jgi:hypothetical protein
MIEAPARRWTARGSRWPGHMYGGHVATGKQGGDRGDPRTATLRWIGRIYSGAAALFPILTTPTRIGIFRSQTIRSQKF